MKKTMNGTVVEVGTLDSRTGEPLGTGAYVDVEGVETLLFVPLTEDECRATAASLYRRVTITIEANQ